MTTTRPAPEPTELRPLAALAADSPFFRTGDGPLDPFPTRAIRADAAALLETLRKAGREDHLPYLAEYGLHLHLALLEETGLGREMPLKTNLALAELVRLAEIEPYTTAHEAGWLNRQFYGAFTAKGFSSYQVYIWCKENNTLLFDAPNAARITDLLKRIDATGRNGVGGSGVCHYGCR